MKYQSPLEKQIEKHRWVREEKPKSLFIRTGFRNRADNQNRVSLRSIY